METEETRKKFLNYFKEKGHTVVPSSSVVPHDDPTLLFINAGMNQFKDVFLGKSRRDYSRAASSQKCIRVGGKHNDLENVGHTKRHLTFFEMLGNFSFGDYFKKEAIAFAWEVSTEVFGLEPEHIWASVFTDDDEAFELWKAHLPEGRIVRFGESENFWAMGDTGPCGPCSELLFDRGPKYGKGATPHEDLAGDRFLEFWNLVFMQFNRDEEGVMHPLPKPCVDTGSGLERVVDLKMDVDNVFSTDLLRSLIAQTEEVSGKRYDPENLHTAPAFHVIADHLRCLAFAIGDGAQPSNVDRGYVLRKVLRRAVRYGRSLGMERPFLAKVLPRLVATMGGDYPELKKAEGRIAELLTIEEEAFLRTLRRGGSLLGRIIEKAQGEKRPISGDEAFKLKDTYGLPIEEILLLAKDSGLSVDAKRYGELEKEAKERSRKAHKTTRQSASGSLFSDYLQKEGPCAFLGYETSETEGKVAALIVDGRFREAISRGEEGMVILNKTPFYAESGGQVGDSGRLKGEGALFEVKDCHSPYKGVIAHIGKTVEGEIRIGQRLTAEVNAGRRQKIANNHTATHLLHWALQKVLGEHIKQAGSVVEPGRLRFDFSHHKALTKEQILKIEELVNEKIRENRAVKDYEMDYEEVQRQEEIKQFFGDKYDARVRVIDIGYSKELCGGTHTSSVGTIGYFRIAKEGSIAAGIRRIEAVSGEEAEALARENEELLDKLAAALKTEPPKLSERIGKMLEENRELAQELKRLKKAESAGMAASLVEKRELVNGIPFLAAEVALPPGELQEFADAAFEKLGSGVLLLGAASEGGKCQLIVRISDDLVAKGIKAVEIIKAIAPIIQGGGGGKAQAAQAGGKAPEKIGEALERARELLQ